MTDKKPFAYYYESHSMPEDFPITLQYFDIQSDKPIVELHTHNVLELGYCHRGNGVFYIRDKFWTFNEGDVSIITRDELHFAQAREGTESPWAFLFIDLNTLLATYFPESVNLGLNRLDFINASHIITALESPKISGLMKSIIVEMRSKNEFYRASTLSLLVLLLVEFRRTQQQNGSHIDKERVNSSSLDRLVPALRLIQARYRENITIESLAESCFMSTRNFTRLFTRIFKKTPLNFLHEQRMAIACNQLLNTDKSVSYIIQSCGYNSHSSFNRQFQKRLGCSPREWRRKSKVR